MVKGSKANGKTLAEALLLIGSDVEIAERIGEDLERTWSHVIHAEGAFWRYGGTNWLTIPEHELRRAVHRYDGAAFTTPVGQPACVKLGKSRVDSVLNELAAKVAQPSFFESVVVGINCASGFIRFDGNGRAQLVAHDPDHRCRHTLPGRWSTEGDGPPPAGRRIPRRRRPARRRSAARSRP